MVSNRILKISSAVLLLSSCSKDNASIPDPVDPLDPITVPAGTQEDLYYFTSIFDNVDIPVKITFPENASFPLPAVVVLHGSGGGWKDDDTDGDGIDDVAYVGELSSQNRAWAKLLNENGYIAAFPESFNARGTVEARGEWDEPPLKLKINAQGSRSRDAVQTLELLSRLVDEDGNRILSIGDVGLMGFSDGATTVYSAIYDHPQATPDSHTWFYDGDIQVPEPLDTNEHPMFAAAVAKYGGASHHGYYGSVSDCEKNIYTPYCPLRVELGEDDGLTKNNLKLIGCMEEKGVSNLTYRVYEDAPHGFDTKDDINGPLSRKHTIDFFDSYLKN